MSGRPGKVSERRNPGLLVAKGVADARRQPLVIAPLRIAQQRIILVETGFVVTGSSAHGNARKEALVEDALRVLRW